MKYSRGCSNEHRVEPKVFSGGSASEVEPASEGQNGQNTRGNAKNVLELVLVCFSSDSEILLDCAIKGF